MTAPVVAGFATSESEVNSTSHTVDLPASIAEGDLLIAFVGFGNNDASDPTWPAGWTLIHNENNTGGASPTLVARWKKATASEPSSITVTSAVNTRHAAVVYRITGAEDPTTQAPEGDGAQANNSTNPDPPNLTPTGGSKDYLWFAAYGASHGSSAAVSAYPTNYTNGKSITNAGTQGTRIAVATAERALTASAENPGTFTHGQSLAEYAAITVAVHPAGAGADPIDLTHLDASPTFDAPTLAGTVALTHLDASATFPTPSIAAAILTDHLDASPTFGAPTLAGLVDLDLLDASATFPAPALAGTISLDALDASATFPTLEVAAGGQTIDLDFLDASPTFDAPVLAGTVTLDLLDASATFPTITVEAPSGAIDLDHLDASATFDAPTLATAIDLDALDASPTFDALEVAHALQAITLEVLDASPAFGTATLASALVLDHLDATPTFPTIEVAAGVAVLELDLLDASPAFGAPSLAAGLILNLLDASPTFPELVVTHPAPHLQGSGRARVRPGLAKGPTVVTTGKAIIR